LKSYLLAKGEYFQSVFQYYVALAKLDKQLGVTLVANNVR